jgi:hypothetical protein
MAMPAPHLRLVEPTEGERNELEVSTALIRRFLATGDTEPIELTAFTNGPIYCGHALNVDQHLQMLREVELLRGFTGAYQLVNGPINPDLVYRYEPGSWHNAKPGRATDRDIQSLRALFIDIDPVRPKNISSTDEQLRAAWDVSHEVELWLANEIGDDAGIGHGCSGNGYFTLIALQPTAWSSATSERISEFLGLLNTKFGNAQTKIDTSTFNPARLMPAPGTMKRKGRNAPERPHRMVRFTCKPWTRRVPLEVLC